MGSVLGVSARTVKEVFNADRNVLPCIYMFVLGIAKVLRDTMCIDAKYPDDTVIAKFGFTKDLARRTSEHMAKYNKIKHVDLKLKHYSYIDPQYMSSAESDIKDFMTAYEARFEFDKDEELVAIPCGMMKMVEKQYAFIGKQYMGHISELITRIKELEDKNEKLLLTHQLELAREKHINEMIQQKHSNELKDKDIELLQFKVKLLEMQK